MLRTSFLLFFLLFFTFVAQANTLLGDRTLQHANKLYYDDNNEKLSLKIYMLSASEGNALAKAQLIKMYYFGIGVEKDRQKARALYNEGVVDKLKQSAKMGNGFAQYLYGYFLDHGIFIQKDTASAMVWYEKAFDNGNITAANNLGTIYSKNKKCSNAFYWYKQAAQLGSVYAQSNLGYFYEEGKCTKQDLKKSLEYYKLAADVYEDAAEAVKRLSKKLDPLIQKIENARVYQNNCDIPSLPSTDASQRALDRFNSNVKKFYRCLDRVEEKNRNLMRKLVREVGGEVVEGGYKYPNYYADAFKKLDEKFAKVRNSLEYRSETLNSRIERYNEKVESANRWNGILNDLHDSLEEINNRQQNQYGYPYNNQWY